MNKLIILLYNLLVEQKSKFSGKIVTKKVNKNLIGLKVAYLIDLYLPSNKYIFLTLKIFNRYHFSVSCIKKIYTFLF